MVNWVGRLKRETALAERLSCSAWDVCLERNIARASQPHCSCHCAPGVPVASGLQCARARQSANAIKLREERNGRANQAAKIGAGKTRQAPHSQAHGLYEKSNEGRQDVQSITQSSTEEGRQVMSLYRNMNAKKKAGTSKSKKKSTISSKSYADMKAGFPNSKKNKAKRKAKMKKA